MTVHQLKTRSPAEAALIDSAERAGSVATAASAIDALRPLGVTDLEMPLSPPRVWSAIQQAAA